MARHDGFSVTTRCLSAYIRTQIKNRNCFEKKNEFKSKDSDLGQVAHESIDIAAHFVGIECQEAISFPLVLSKIHKMYLLCKYQDNKFIGSWKQAIEKTKVCN